MHKRKSVRFWSAFGPIAWILTFTVAARPLPSESVRTELIRLQNQSGLSLVAVRENKIYTVAFTKHKLNKPKPLPIDGDLMGGSVSEDGTKIAFEYCRELGLTHPTPESTECPGGLVLATMQFDGSDVHEFPYLANPAYMVCWSHDSSKLALVARDVRKEKYAPLELQILDLVTGTTQVIGTGREFVDPQCWSPDDKQVVYTANNMAGQGFSAIYDIDKKTSRDFSKGTRPTWSPDGNWIALLDCPPSLWGCKYFAVRQSGTGRKVLFESESATALWWSPDSRFVAYVNGAGALERTPPQLLREMVRLRVRRLEDNSTDSFADFFDGDTMEFQWVTKKGSAN